MSRKKLWDFYGGEPFMENPHLAIVGNPFKVGSIIERKQSGFRKISQKKGKQVMPYRKARKRRTRSRKNPFPTAGLAINPRRRRRVRRNEPNPRRRRYAVSRRRRNEPNPRRRRSRRNPALLGVTLPPVNMILWGAGGFIVPPMVEGFVNRFLPVEVTSSVLGRYAVKIASVLGLTWLTKTVMSTKEAFPVALGGSLYIVVSAVNEFIPQIVTQPAPTTGTQAYRNGMIKAYRQGMIGTGINQYSRTNLARALPGLAQTGPQWGLGPNGMLNPTQADPRFSDSIGR